MTANQIRYKEAVTNKAKLDETQRSNLRNEALTAQRIANDYYLGQRAADTAARQAESSARMAAASMSQAHTQDYLARAKYDPESKQFWAGSAKDLIMNVLPKYIDSIIPG